MLALVVLLSLLVAAHLSAVGVAAVAPLVGAWLEWRGGENERSAAAPLARDALWLLLAGALLGLVSLALLYVMGWSNYFHALAAVPRSRWYWGVAELLFSAVLTYCCYRAWSRLPESDSAPRRRWLARLAALVSSTNLLYHFPLLFSSVVVISKRPELWPQPLDGRGMRAILFSGEALSRAGHFLLAAIAMTGVWLVVRSLRRGKSGGPNRAADELGGDNAASAEPAANRAPAAPAGCHKLAGFGARLSLTAVLLQIPLGVWLFFVLPESLRERLLLGDLTATAALAGGVAAVVVLLHHLLAIALGDAQDGVALRAILLAAAVMVLMVLASHRLAEFQPAPPRPPGVDSALVPGAPIENPTPQGHML